MFQSLLSVWSLSSRTVLESHAEPMCQSFYSTSLRDVGLQSIHIPPLLSHVKTIRCFVCRICTHDFPVLLQCVITPQACALGREIPLWPLSVSVRCYKQFSQDLHRLHIYSARTQEAALYFLVLVHPLQPHGVVSTLPFLYWCADIHTGMLSSFSW